MLGIKVLGMLEVLLSGKFRVGLERRCVVLVGLYYPTSGCLVHVIPVQIWNLVHACAADLWS